MQKISRFFSWPYIKGINKKLCQMKKDFFLKSSELWDLLVKGTACGIGESLARTYGSCDNSNSRMAEEEELRNCAQILLFEMQKASIKIW